MSQISLLGPQRLAPTIAAVLSNLEVEGPVAVITAGWRDAESDDATLAGATGVEIVNLELYRRTEEVFDSDPELHATLRRRQRRLQQQQRLYRRRLDCALDGYRHLVGLSAAEPDDQELIDRERLDALEAVRALDAHQLSLIEEIRLEAEEEARPLARAVVAAHRRQLEELIEPCSAVLISGGHVASLLNRLRLFDVESMIGARPLVAWSAGAMVLAERIVLFHDSPPWGAGNSEVLDFGLGLAPGVLPLPHARRRLRLDDAQRVELLVRRFAPLRCVGLDEGAELRSLGRDPGGEPVWSGHEVRLLDLEPAGVQDESAHARGAGV